ncbi:MAG: hypothetical protein Fur0012_06240 [Elusimicrobiota bacterium]
MKNLESPLPDSVKKEYSITLSKDTVSTLRSLTEDTNEKVRLSAVELLWQMQDSESPKIIKKMLENETETSVKVKIIELISRDKTRLSLKLLADALKNYDKETRIKAADALGEYSTEEAIKVLNSALNDYDEEVKLKALESVNKIKKQIEQHREEKLKELESPKPVFKVE